MAITEYSFRASSVCSLLCVGGPSAVGRLIVAIVVNALDGVFAGGPIPHVTDEGCKRLGPLRTHGYAPTAVVLVTILFGVAASSEHSGPHLVFCGPRQAVLCVASHKNLPVKTAATPRPAGHKAGNAYPRFMPAITSAHPVRLTALSGRAESTDTGTYGLPPRELLAKYVCALSHVQSIANWYDIGVETP